MTLQEFEERFAAAAPGEIIVYYTGHLAQAIELNFTLSQIARTARELGTPKDCCIFFPLRDYPQRRQQYGLGKGYLSQRRIGSPKDRICEYRITKARAS